MDFTNKNQILGVALFLVGSWILTLCRQYENKLDEKFKDPKTRWAVIDGNKNTALKQKSLRGTIMTVVGLAMALYGIVLFLINLTAKL